MTQDTPGDGPPTPPPLAGTGDPEPAGPAPEPAPGSRWKRPRFVVAVVAGVLVVAALVVGAFTLGLAAGGRTEPTPVPLAGSEKEAEARLALISIYGPGEPDQAAIEEFRDSALDWCIDLATYDTPAGAAKALYDNFDELDATGDFTEQEIREGRQYILSGIGIYCPEVMP